MNSTMKMKKLAGFTLIEMVIVVVILGFLAVTAIPKFLDLTDQAKQANIEGMAGGFATAVSLARAQWEAEGRPQDGTGRNVVDYDGSVVVLTTEANGIRPGYVVSSVGGEDNGAALKKAILQYAVHWRLGENFMNWIYNANHFCSTLVDRIVSGYPTERATEIQSELGYEDELLVAGEYYHSWVIQANDIVQQELPFSKTDLKNTFTP